MHMHGFALDPSGFPMTNMSIYVNQVVHVGLLYRYLLNIKINQQIYLGRITRVYIKGLTKRAKTKTSIIE